MSNTAAIVLAWGAVFGVFALYLLTIVKRTKAATKVLPVDRQRWMTTDTPGDAS